MSRHTRIFKLIGFVFFLFMVVMAQPAQAQAKKFVLVIDAGHGGNDPGAVGDISREKDINLSVALKFGSLVEKNFNVVKVVYTRNTDKYITLQERANIANQNHADLFISIHTNAAKNASAFGTETFTLGLTNSKANLEVAMRENSVILLEDDYKTKYSGFDPRSVDSYIMFEFMQDKYIDKSIEMATLVQNQFTRNSRRHDRGVRQAGFWVLHRTAAPSILIELGFISNREEERFMASEAGQNSLANSIFNAFVAFKKDYDKKSGVYIAGNYPSEIINQPESTTPTNKPTEQAPQTNTANDNRNTTTNAATNTSSTTAQQQVSAAFSANQPVFKVQILASAKRLNNNSAELKGEKDSSYFIEGGLYKYTIGEETDYNKIQALRRELSKKFPGCFIIAFVGNTKMSANEALKLIK